MNKKYLSLASIVTCCFLLLLISGCGSSGNKEGDTASTTAVGDRLCVQCHSAVTEALTGQTLMAQYENSSPHRDSAHANEGNGCEACHGNAGQHQGVGPITYPNPYADSGARCADCHNGNYAGNFNTKFAASKHANMTIEESANCVRCHTHEGAVLSNIAGVTGDYNVITNKAYQTIPIPAKGWSQFKCQTCHEHGAGLRTVMARYNNPFKADSANGTLVAWDPNNNREHDQYDLCTSCHTMTTNTYGTGVIGSNGRETSAAIYMASGTPANAATGKPGTAKSGYHETSWYRIITTTHYDNPATGLNATDVALTPGNVIEGYVIRNNKETPCFDCHAHEANTGTRYGQTTTPTLYTDWAQSGHAGGLLAAKYAAATGKSGAAQVDSVMISGVSAAETSTDYPSVDAAGAAITITRKTSAGDAWAHYQWERTLKADGTSDRGLCQKCHTATGISNFLASPATYDYKANDFSHLSGWVKATATAATVPSPQQEVLYCWGCHTNAGTGAVRDPVAAGKVAGIPSEYKFEGGAVNGTFPNVASSNVCIGCHAGRLGGMNVKARTDLVSGATASFTNSHYLPAAGVLFKAIGYEYAGTGRNYADSASFRHATVGTTAQPNTGTSGPCVSCHMGPIKPAQHKWQLAGFQGGTCGTSAAGVAGACHASLTRVEIDEEKESYEDALFALSAVLKDKGFTWTPSNPYFAAADWTRGGTVDGKNMLGAAFNLNMLLHEPGGFTHNRYYVKRLIFDSIDFAYNGKLEALTLAAAGTYYEGSDVQAAITAMVGKTYADHAGIVQTFTAAQAAKAIAYLDRRPDASYPTYPGMQRP
jgi:hypothetical protein